MKEQETAKRAGRTARERCVCHEVMDRFGELFGVSPAAREHLSNSRIELLKAVRQVIDDRIEHLSGAGRQGAKIRVE